MSWDNPKNLMLPQHQTLKTLLTLKCVIIQMNNKLLLLGPAQLYLLPVFKASSLYEQATLLPNYISVSLYFREF